jgi:pantoate--beta-alanine ligase
MPQLLYTIDEVRKTIKNIKSSNKTIGLVPTMGYLHDGHISLINQSNKDNDITIISVFVNPTQFGVNEDFDSYPRDLKRDLSVLNDSVDYVFTPSKDIMYPSGFDTQIIVNKYSSGLCGVSRPGHFNGVAIVVTKLLNIITPDKVYFGEKDMQQYLLISQLIKDLNINVNAIGCTIIRESDGLAMSSRNVYLSNDERKQAPILYKALNLAKELVAKGLYNTEQIIKLVTATINTMPLAEIDYIEIRDMDSWEAIENIENGKVLLALAVKFGKTRLIDNMIINK